MIPVFAGLQGLNVLSAKSFPFSLLRPITPYSVMRYLLVSLKVNGVAYSSVSCYREMVLEGKGSGNVLTGPS